VRGWLRRFSAGRAPATSVRWVVLDCETTGLDPAHDHLLSIGAIGVAGQRIAAGDRFDMLLRQERPSTAEDVLIHGIGAQAQASGEDPRRVLEAFLNFAGAAPLAAFHADFDRAVLQRAARQHGLALEARWLDVARLLPALFPGRRHAERGLDDWLGHFRIAHPARHDALSDAYVSAQLLQIALAEAARQGFATVRQVIQASRSVKWMGA